MNNFQMYCLHFWKPCQVWTKCRNEIVEEETLLLDSRPPGIKSYPSHSYNLGTLVSILGLFWNKYNCRYPSQNKEFKQSENK